MLWATQLNLVWGALGAIVPWCHSGAITKDRHDFSTDVPIIVAHATHETKSIV